MKHYSTLSLIAALALVASTAVAQSPFYQTHVGRQHDNAVTASAETRASNTVELSYLDVTQQMWNDMGISVNGKWRMGVAVVFPKSMVSKYIGSKVTHISFGWNTTKISPVAEFFVRTSLDGDDVASATATLKNKSTDANNYYGSWNKIALDEPYVIEADKDLVIGYFADMEPVGAGVSCIPFSSYGISSPEHCQYIMNCSLPEEEGGNMWIELINEQTGKPTSPLFASATIVDDSGTMINLCEVMEAYCLPVITKDVATGGLLRIVNRGTNDITSLELTYTFDGAHRSETVNLSKALTPAKQSNIAMPFYALGSGKHTVAVTKVNGKTNKIVAPADYQTIGVPADVASQHTMKPLVEYFCSENDYNSAKYYETLIVPGLDVNGDKMVVVNQHMNDQFMQFDFDAENEYDDATMLLIDFANGDLSQVYMPVMTVNRTGLPNLYDPSLSIPDNPAIWVITPQFADAILYEPALKTPTFASVEAACKLDSYKENLDITVTGNIAEGVLPEGEELYLSVYVMEDDVFTDSQEMPDDAEFNALYPDGNYQQQNVIRLCLTPLYGTAVGKGGNFSKEFTVEFDSEWKVDDMSVVAFLTRSEKNDCMNRTVINATETFLRDTDGVESISADRTASDAAQHVFSLTGQRVSRLQKGIYVVGGKKIVIR